MPTVGTLNIDLRMGTAALIAGANKAKSTIEAMASSIKGSFVKMSMSLTPVVDVGQVIGGIKAIATAQSKFIDDTGKLADRLNITTESFVGMAHAADLAGVGTDEFGGMLEKLQKNLGKFAEDEGKTQEVVEGLGISLKDLKRQDLDKTFLDITDAIAKTHDPLKRSELLIALFGKSGQKLANTMMAGKQSIRDAMIEAKELGMTFSRFDAAKVEAANDAFTRMKGALAGIGNTLTIGLAPYFEVAFNKARDFIKTSGQDMARAFVTSATSFVDGMQKAYELSLRFGIVMAEAAINMWQVVHAMATLTNNNAIAEMAAGNTQKLGFASGKLNQQANAAAAAPRWSIEVNAAADKVAKAFIEGMKVNMIDRAKIMFDHAREDVTDLLRRSGFDAFISGDSKQQAMHAKFKAEEAAREREKLAAARQQQLAAAQQTKDSIVNPLDAWGKRQSELTAQFARGDITAQDYARATSQNKDSLAGAVGGGHGPSPAASGAEFGSGSAQSITAGSKMNYSGQTNANKSLADLVRIAAKQLIKSDQLAAAAVEQVAALKNMQIVNF